MSRRLRPLAFFLRALAAGSVASAIAAPGNAAEDAGFAARRALVLEHVRSHLLGPGSWNTKSDPATNRSVNDIGKHWWPRLLADALLDPTGARVVRQADGSSVTGAEIVRGLCHHAPDHRPPVRSNPAIGYLYFSPVGLGWALHAFPDLIRETDRQVVFEKALRYEPALSALNMFTGQGTENHMLMGRTGGYLICQAVITRGPADPGSGHLHAEAVRRLGELKEYFLETARSTYAAGFGEWDSSIYYPYVVACWLGLHDHAADREVRDAARAVLDWIAATVALRTVQGVFGGAEQRSGRPMRSGESNLDQLGWLWWGGLPGDRALERFKPDVSQLVYACLSRYRPPAVVAALARKEFGPLPAQHFETKPSYLVHGTGAVRQQTRALFYVERDFALGAAIARPTGGWTAGDNQDLLWKLVAPTQSGPSAAVVSGPLAREPWRQVGMWKNVLIDSWHVPMNARELHAAAMRQIEDWRQKRAESLRRTFPDDQSRENTVRPRTVTTTDARASLHVSDGRVVTFTGKGPEFLQVENAFLCLRPIGVGLAPIPAGGFGGFVLEVGSVSTHGTLAQFAAAIAARDRSAPARIEAGTVELQTLGGERIAFRHRTDGTYVEPEYDWGYGAEQPGGYVLMSMPPFQFPTWPAGAGHGRVPDLAVDGEPVAARFTEAVYAGPWLTLRDRILRVTDGRRTHEVDFSGASPRFTSR